MGITTVLASTRKHDTQNRYDGITVTRTSIICTSWSYLPVSQFDMCSYINSFQHNLKNSLSKIRNIKFKANTVILRCKIVLQSKLIYYTKVILIPLALVSPLETTLEKFI